jgi:hypothetical protein
VEWQWLHSPKWLGMLHKGKIHCSCAMCRSKSYDELSMRDKKLTLRDRQNLHNFWIENDFIEY